MALAVGQVSKGGTTGGTTATTTAVNTATSGSTFEVAVIYDGTSFTSITDNKSNTWTQVGTETTINGSNAKCRRYKKEGGAGGTGHTVTVTCASGIIVVLFMEITGSTVVSDGTPSQARDNASPFASPSITTTSATTLLTSVVWGDSGSNPATTAESTGFSVQVSELDGSSYWVAALATRAVTSTGTYNSSFTQSGTTNSVVGILAWKETGSSGTNITSGLGQLTLTGYAPTIRVPERISAGLGQLTFTGLAPTVSSGTGNQSVSAGLGALTLTGLAPTVSVATGNVSVSAGLGQLTFTGYAPEQTLTLASPPPGVLVLSGHAPTVNVTFSANPGVGQLTLTGLAPSVLATANQFASPGLGQLSITGLAPSIQVSAPGSITTGLGALTLTGLAPSIFVNDSANIVAGLGALTFTGLAPSVQATANVGIAAGLGALTLTGLAPAVTATANQFAAPDVGTLTVTGFAPTIQQAGSFTVAPGVGVLELIGLAPSVRSSGQTESDSGGWPLPPPRKRKKKEEPPQVAPTVEETPKPVVTEVIVEKPRRKIIRVADLMTPARAEALSIEKAAIERAKAIMRRKLEDDELMLL